MVIVVGGLAQASDDAAASAVAIALFCAFLAWLILYGVLWSRYRAEGEPWDAFLRHWYLPFAGHRFRPEGQRLRMVVVGLLLGLVLPLAIAFVVL